MTFSEALYRHLKTLEPKLYFGSASGVNADYFVMLPISDLEQPGALCDSEAGELLVQFSWYGDGGAGTADQKLAALKSIVANIATFVYSGATYEVWNNRTGGVRPLGGVTLNTWDAIFESQLAWRKL